MKFILLGWASAFISVHGAPTTLVLNSGAGQNEIFIEAEIDGIPPDSDTTTYSGTIDLDLEILDGEVVAFEMTGGLLSASDISFYFEPFPETCQTITFIDATATPISTEGREVLTTAGSFSAPQHVFRFQDGCIEFEGAFGDSKNLISDDPFDAAGQNSGTITLGAATVLSSTISQVAIAEQYEVSLSLALDSTVSSNEGGITVTTETVGTVTAQGMLVEYLHPFYEWAAANAPDAGLALDFEVDADQDGICDGISWALGYSAGAAEQFPTPVWDSVEEAFTLSLPGPTVHPVRLEASPNLSPNGWEPVLGYDPIPVGWSGKVAIPDEGDSPRFFRFVSSLP